MVSTQFYAENSRYFAPFGRKRPKKQSFLAVFCRPFPFEAILPSVAKVLLTFSLFGPFWVRFGSREKFKSHWKNITFWPESYTESDKNVKILQEIQHFLHFRWPACTAWWPFGTAKTIHFCRPWPFLRLEKSKYCKKYNIFWCLVASHTCPMTIWHSKNNTFLSAMALPETRKVKILQEIWHFFDLWWPPISSR